MKRILVLLLVAVFVITAALPAYALRERVSVIINGKSLYNNELMLIDNTTYVKIDSFRKAMGDNSGVIVRAFDNYIAGNGRYIYNDKICFYENGSVYVPLRSAAKLYLADVRWSASESTAYITSQRNTIVSGDIMYNTDDVYWLSRIINAESRGEPIYGKLAVGNVVMNRVASNKFPGDIKSVIFDDKFGIQFTPVANGSIYNNPNDECIIAAKMVLEGYRISNDILYFIAEALAQNLWTVNNCVFIFSVGSHDFYA
ncbi:MAG: cell wall hydrolase [Eubacteriales bacterium]